MGKPQVAMKFPEKRPVKTGQELEICIVDTRPALLLFVATHS